MCLPTCADIDRLGASLRRVAIVSLISVPIAVEVVFGELLFAAHVVFLTEALGFLWGLIAFSVLWALLGLLVLAAKDAVGPRLTSLADRLRRFRLPEGARLPALTAVAGAAVSSAALTAAVAGGDIVDWLADHRGDALAFVAAAAVVFAVLMLIARVGRESFERWVRRVAASAGPGSRALATVLTMAVLGPAFAWLLLPVLGHSQRSVYSLTLASAPLFGLAWVPFYGLGVWSVLQSVF